MLCIGCASKTKPEFESIELSPVTTSDQKTYWNFIGSNVMQTWNQPYGPATVFNTYSLDLFRVRAELSKAKHLSDSKTSIDNFILIPDHTGELVQFKFYKSSVLSPEMEKKFPQIRSYIIQHHSNTSVQGRLDLNDKGLRALIFWKDKTLIIDPSSPNDSLQYVVYFREDLNIDRNNIPFEISDTLQQHK